MPNTNVDLSQYEDITIHSDIHTLKDFLDEKDSWQIPTKYKVIEYFPPENSTSYSPTVYDVTNLVITDIEGGMAIFDGYLDNEDVMLFDNMIDNDIAHNLNVLLISSIIMISINKHKTTISFDSGYIQLLY